MATYFHGHGSSTTTTTSNQEIQAADGLHTLYLMNPNYISAYNSASADTSASSSSHQRQQQQQHHQQQAAAAAHHHNMILLNSTIPHALNSTPLTHAPAQQSQFLTLPFAQPISADDPVRSANNFHYNLWASSSNNNNNGNNNNNNNHIDVVSAVTSTTGALVTTASHHPYQIQQVDNNNDLFRRPAAVVSPTNQQGLSLSLSGGNGLYNNRTGGGSSSLDIVGPTNAGSDHQESNGVQNFIMGSKYLKAAQELLDEVVNVGKTACKNNENNQLVKKEKDKLVLTTDNNGENEGGNVNNGSGDQAGGSSGGLSQRAAELSMTQRQELQMKKTKLISMLDEVEQRYRQYHHQMKIVVSSFEQVAGFGAAKSYTSLALKTISKQFRCLKDAIMSQIKEASKSLGEEGDDCLGVKGEGSRLRMIDHQLRQQRALQQLGMMQHNAWRPQRGLPERAVSVLRAWLFEHFLHPYPKDSDKHMLAKQTGLTRSQVSNWFINARVRLWKPMVEEMYLEEVKDHPEQQKGSNKDNINAASTSKSNEPQQDIKTTSFQQPMMKNNQNASPTDNVSNNSTISTSPNASSFQAPPPGFTLIGSSSSDMEGLLQYKSPKKARGHETQNSPSSILSMDMEMKAAGEINFSRQDSSKFGTPIVYGGQNAGGFGAYHHQLGELGRFNPDQQLAQSFHNNGNVSLTLGLPPGENLTQSYFSNQTMHGFERRLEMGGNAGSEADGFCGMNNNNQGQVSPHSNIGFQNIDIQNRKRYAAQLLPDFVA